MSSEIVPGDVVVCVDAKPDRADPRADMLAEGRHYRVTVVGTRTDGVPACAFRVLPCPHNPNKGYAFALRRFRKIRPGRMEFTGLTAREKEAV